MSRPTKMIPLTAACLRRHPLPSPPQEGGKDARGQVVAIGGSEETPGAILLAAVAALRAGAGKLKILSVPAHLSTIAIAVPEALVAALATAKEKCERADAIIYGPGMSPNAALLRRLRQLQASRPQATFVVDSEAIVSLGKETKTPRAKTAMILTPHAGEMAKLVGETRQTIEKDPVHWARFAAQKWQAVVALKGAETVIAATDGTVYRNRSGSVGLATSGSGDALAGLIAGVASRGASALTATLWGVHLHALAGERLARRYGGIGFLAREIADEVPSLMARLAKRSARR